MRSTQVSKPSNHRGLAVHLYQDALIKARHSVFQPVQRLLALLVLSLLTACGGDSGSSTPTKPSPTMKLAGASTNPAKYYFSSTLTSLGQLALDVGANGTCNPTPTTTNVSYSSSDDKVVTLDSKTATSVGFTAQGGGTATITAKYAEDSGCAAGSATFDVTVQPAPTWSASGSAISGTSASPAALSVLIGKSVTVTSSLSGTGYGAITATCAGKPATVTTPADCGNDIKVSSSGQITVAKDALVNRTATVTVSQVGGLASCGTAPSSTDCNNSEGSVTVTVTTTAPKGLAYLFSASGANGTIPSNLSSYDNLSQEVLGVFGSNTHVMPVFVASDGLANNDGSSWAKAKDLSSAISGNTAESGHAYLLLLKAGTYKPSSTDRTASFALKSNMAIVGGFVGSTTASGDSVYSRSGTLSSPSTILSGEINDLTTTSDNSYHVVCNSRADSLDKAVLYGVKITAGNANGSEAGTASCTTGSAGLGGGMMLAAQGEPPLISNVVFSANAAYMGGGLLLPETSKVSLRSVIFDRNTSSAGSAKGAGMVLGRGGGYTDKPEALLANTFFTGGGLAVYRGAAYVFNSTFTGNGTAIMADTTRIGVKLVNSIVWGNTTGTEASFSGAIQYDYSVIQGATASTTVSASDPKLTVTSLLPTIAADSPAINLGAYVRYVPTARTTFYFSTDGSTWSEPLPSGAVDIVPIDMGDNDRVGRPDAGAMEYVN